MVFKEFKREINEGTLLTIIGNNRIVESLKEEESCSFVLNKNLSVFNGETVGDEIAFSLECKGVKKEIIEKVVNDYAKKFALTSLLLKDPFSLGYSDKVKLKLCSAFAQRTKVVALCDVLSELDSKDLKRCLKQINDYRKLGGIVINITSNIEEALYGEELIIYNKGKIALEGKTLSVLNEEKILKRLGIGLPFYIELSKYLIDYNLIDKYYLDEEGLVGAIWKK